MSLHDGSLSNNILSDPQKIAIALCKSVSATFSLIASSILIYKIYLRYQSQSRSTVASGSLRSLKYDGITTYHRMLLGISVLDVIHSISSAFSTVLVPSYTHGIFARGTNATCAAQGAIQQLTATIVIYMAMLNTYFMIKIRYNTSDAEINRRYEIWFHAIPIVFFVSTAITGLSMGVFGPIILPELGCWLDSFCAFTHTCTRSGPIFYNHVDVWMWFFGFIWFFLCVILLCVNGVLIYTAIRTQERRNEKYFAARLQRQSATTATVSQPSLSSSLQYSVTKSAAPHQQKGDGGVVHDPPKQQSEEGNVDLDRVNETGETGHDSSEENEKMLESSNAILDFEGSDMPLPSMVFSLAAKDDSQVKMTQHQQQKTNIKQSRIAAVQSTLYVLSALFTAFWVFMIWVTLYAAFSLRWRIVFALMTNIASPSQGVFNLLLYNRMHYIRLRETNTSWSRWKCVRVCLFSSD